MAHVVLTALGSDRPGLVDELSRFIYEQGGNMEDSRMVNLRGQFAMMVLISAEQAAIGVLARNIDQLHLRTGLHVSLREVERAQADHPSPAVPYVLKASAIDQPGLVHRLTHLLRRHQANIESMETSLKPAPITGAPLFEMSVTLSLPANISIAGLRQELGALCDEINIDWQLFAA